MCRTLLSARPGAALNNLTTLYSTVSVFVFFFSISESGRRSMSGFYRMAAQQVQPASHTQPPLDCFPGA